MAQSPTMHLKRWLAGGAACVAAIALAAWLLVDIGGQARERTAVPPSSASVAARAPVPTREAQIITELRDDMGPPSPTSRKPEWAAPAVRLAGNRQRAASAPQAPGPAAPAQPQREAQARPAAGLPASRAVAAEPCSGQSGIAQSICLARQCSEAAWRGHSVCRQVREAEQRMRERYEQGG